MKILTIAIKDTLVRFRDRNALVLMLAAPLLISFVMGAAFGNVQGSSSPITDIPVVLVNADAGDLGQTVVDVFAAIKVDESASLFQVTELADKAEALSRLEQGDVRGVVYIPPHFSQRVMAASGPSVSLELYTDPTANVSPGIIRGVVNSLAAQFNMGAVGNVTAVTQLAQSVSPAAAQLLANPAQLGQILSEESAIWAQQNAGNGRITLETAVQGEAGEPLNLLNYFVPSMAIFFLMFAVFAGTRSILEEERNGTLYRLMTTPTRRAEVLLGKIGGTFLTGLLQFAVLVLASGLLFGVDWGQSPVGVVLLALATVAAATSLGAFVASFARDVNQAGVLGTAVTLVFAILGGNFIDYRQFPGILEIFSKMTINRWSLEGFVELTIGQASLNAVMPNVAALCGMAVLFFGLSLLFFDRRFVK